jgi:hypothetical protein
MIALSLLFSAWAGPTAVVARAPVAVGELAEIEVLAALGPVGREAPTVEVEGGELVALVAVAQGYRTTSGAFDLTDPRAGHWRADVRVLRASGATVRIIDTDRAAVSLPVEVVRGAPCLLNGVGLEADPLLPSGGATGRVHMRFRAADAACAARLQPGALVVRASEGRVAEVRLVEGGIDVSVEIVADRIARNVVVALFEPGVAGLEPVVGVVALRGKPSLSVQAEAASSASVKVGRRSFGPFVASELGMIEASLDTLPGDTSYEITVTDSVGNTRRATGPLPGAARTSVAVVEDGPGRAGWVVARTPTGQPWTGGPPRCTASSGGRVVALAARIPGVWRLAPTEEGVPGFDLRFACVVDDVHVEVRVPARPPVPARIDLRAYPEVLSSDMPVGQVVATLVTADGLPAAFFPATAPTTDGVARTGAPVLHARHGALLAEAAPAGQARASYRGEDARTYREDLVTATWSVPSVTTDAWSIELHAAGRGATAEARVRVLAPDGAPVRDRDVEVAFGSLGAPAGEGTTVRGRTDARGWVAVEGPIVEGAAALVVARVPGAALVAKRMVLPGESVLLPSAERPDLEASLVLPIRAGRVRDIVVEMGARSVRRGEPISVRVELRDASGGRVTDEPVRLTATEGGAVALTRHEDGTWHGVYTAVDGDDAASVTLRAQSGDVDAEAIVQVTPRPYRGSASLAVGLQRDAGRTVPVGAASIAIRGPALPEALAFRASVALRDLTRSVDDLVTGGTIDVRATLATIDLGAEVVRRFGRTNLALGGGAAFAPYWLAVDYGGRRGTEGVGVTGPGAVARTRVGYRFGAAEVYSELAWTFLPLDAPTVRFDGGVGGANVVAGYRLSW